MNRTSVTLLIVVAGFALGAGITNAFLMLLELVGHHLR
jgi:hypothetical protein